MPEFPDEMDEAAWEAYVRLTSKIIDLPIPDASMPGVISTLMTTAKVAQPLLEVEIPEGTEMGPTFTS
ncbi:MAG: DUF4089 domain-containing protein [Verrucomicrobiota bacterium]